MIYLKESAQRVGSFKTRHWKNTIVQKICLNAESVDQSVFIFTLFEIQFKLLNGVYCTVTRSVQGLVSRSRNYGLANYI